jgi:hypothetical protein
MEAVATGFERSLAGLKSDAQGGWTGLSADQRRAYESECRLAEAVAIHCRSSANQARYILAARSLAKAASQAEQTVCLETQVQLLNNEIALAKRLHELQCEDSRLGFEASNHYFYVPADLAEKVLNCRELLARCRSKLEAL